MPAKLVQAAWSMDIAPQPVIRSGSMILPENRFVNMFSGRSQRPFGM